MSQKLNCAYQQTDTTTFDAIGVGSGISGGWAAKELCEQGLKTLVLERGRPIEHIKDYPTATLNPWDFPHRGPMPQEVRDSSVSSTLPWAQATGNLNIRPFSVVHSVIYDETKKKAVGVRVIDTNTQETTDYFARIIFLNASALNTNLILLNSKSHRFPNGLGNDNDLMGKYIAFHLYRGSVSANIDGFQDKYYFGRNPTDPILVNYRNLERQDTDYFGGFTTFLGARRPQGDLAKGTPSFGADFKEAMTRPGGWRAYMYMQGETIPKASNHVRLSATETHPWGIPQLITSVGYDENDEKMIADFLTQTTEMLEKAGGKDIHQNDTHQSPGLDIHEMGGVRVGRDPKTSLLNAWNQLHACPNVFVTDGACMTSTGNQSPSILYMALTARATNYAVGEMKKGNL